MQLARFLNKTFKKGGFILTDANSKDYIIGEPDKNPIRLKILNKNLHYKLLLHPDLYFGEAYTNGEIIIENGTLTDAGTAVADLVANGTYTSPYATSVQVDEAVSFITSQEDNPWLIWMGFNAPHDPFQDPPQGLAPQGGYSTAGPTNKDNYIRMLEALDTEIGRLLESVDLDKTNVPRWGDDPQLDLMVLQVIHPLHQDRIYELIVVTRPHDGVHLPLL